MAQLDQETDGEESLHSLEDSDKESSDEDFQKKKRKDRRQPRPSYPRFNSEVDMKNP